jgi:RimJ/RimL family protein N-acetyltransferase
MTEQSTRDTVSAAHWLRRGTPADIDALHALACEPAVYRYLADNRPPDRAVVEPWLDVPPEDRAAGLGTWLLLGPSGVLDGAVLLQRDAAPRTAELVYLLHPRAWGQGLATRMSWTVMARAFAVARVDAVIAGADVPNVASIAVMRRIGMTFLRDVVYPLGAGVQYRRARDDPPPTPVPDELVVQADDAAR